MKRRDLLKGMSLSSLGLAGLNPQVSLTEMLSPFDPESPNKDPEFEQFGRTEYEKLRDAKLFAEQFFNSHEMKTISVLADIIIPKDSVSGSASDAGVPAFIEFMAKDKVEFQTPLRGGLTWLDNQSRRRYEKNFIDLKAAEQIAIVEDIAYPERKKAGMSHGIAFFSLMRNLTATGFWTSKMGIEDMGYAGNRPNVWDGPPAEVLRQYDL